MQKYLRPIHHSSDSQMGNSQMGNTEMSSFHSKTNPLNICMGNSEADFFSQIISAPGSAWLSVSIGDLKEEMSELKTRSLNERETFETRVEVCVPNCISRASEKGLLKYLKRRSMGMGIVDISSICSR